jgi:transposase
MEPGRGAPRLREAERRQIELRAMTLDELIGPDHLARLIWDIVGRFDLAPLLDAIAAREAAPGHPQTDPRILVSLWLYATLDGLGSARELERLCEQHAAYRWLCGGVSINHHTLSDFRTLHAGWLDHELIRSINGLLASGTIDLQTVAQDGLRVRAGAGKSSFRRQPRLQDFARAAREHVERLKAEVAADPGASRTRREAAQMRAARERLQRVEAALAAMPQAQKRKQQNKGDPAQARVSSTDAEARVMKMPDGGFRPAFNIQYCAEAKLGLVIGVGVGVSGADQDELVPMHARVKQAFGRTVTNWLADGGYVSQVGIETLSGCGTAPCIAAGEVLKRCDSPAIQQWQARMQTEEAKALYRWRARTIEWVNARVRNGGLNAVPVRGVTKTRAIALWHALAHNVSRLLSLGTAWPTPA